MFGNKPAFGAASTGFGSFNSTATTASPFGGFKPTTGSSAFGAPPAFGANATAQPATGGGLFGASNTTTGGLFGSTPAAATPAFGNTSGGFGFGATTSAGGLFSSNTTTGGLFGQTTPGFGAKPAGGFGFGGTATTGTTGGLFGNPSTSGTGLFGQQNTTIGGGGLFSSTPGGTFGQQQQSGTAHVKYNPVVGTDVVVKSGTQQNVNIKHHCITCMKEYENKSLEELRLEDYVAGRKGSTNTGLFGFNQQQTENKPLFGGTTAFGQTPTTTASSLFGGGITNNPGFGQSSAFSFGGNAQNTTNTTGGLFGAAKPAFGATATTGTGLFGATTTQAPSFGTTTPSFGFGSNTNQSGGLFGAKPATTGFGSTPASNTFGGFGSAGTLFGAKTAQSSAAPTFGGTAPAFGSLSGGFGTNTSASGGGLFGANNTFGKPNTTQPTFGFNAPATGLGTGLGGGLGSNTFQTKPAGSAFGTLGGGSSLFQTPAQPNFSSGLDGSGLGGGGLFNNTSSLGGLGMGALGANAGMNANNTLSGASAAGNVHEQILTLVARPYGDSPLFKDLTPDNSATSDEASRPQGTTRGAPPPPQYRVAAAPGLKLQPRAHDKKSLFDGLEESDASLEDKLSLKPSRKRLVLRPRSLGDDHNDSGDHNTRHDNRSLEDLQRETNGPKSKETDRNNKSTDDQRLRKDFNSNNNSDAGSERQNSWLNSSKPNWSAEKEKFIENESTPRLYPNLGNLDKEIPLTAERRASWLTTKPFRKPLSTNPDSAENTVRELAVRQQDRSLDKENVDTLSVSEEEHVAPRDMPPHPAGVKLTRPGYYTIPSLDEMIKYIRPDGSCVVPHLTIGRKNYGNVFYDCEIDVAGLDLDSLVHFLNKEVTIYPDDSDKPPVGQGLNRRAIVTLDRIWPRDKTEKKPITDPDRLLAMDYEGKLRRVCDKHDTKFIEYRPQTGSWVFRVEHFSKYSLTDSDEEDDVPEVLKKQIVNQQLQQSAPPAPPKPPATIQPGLSGLGGLGAPSSGLGAPSSSLGTPSGLGASLGTSGGLLSGPLISGFGHEDNLLAMHQTSLNLLNGMGKAFDMDTTEDAESSMYQDVHREFGVKSPTSELARLEHRQSHNVQLMKASLYAGADTEMEDDMSISTGDQLVPRGTPSLITVPRPLSTQPLTPQEDVPPTEELPMRPLEIRPRTVVLNYHRKVPPFKMTIAGRLNASCIADMAVCRARHSRVGFGPSHALVYATTYDSVAELPRTAELCDLGRYVVGRTGEDWSEPVVARLAMGRETHAGLQEILTRQLETLLEYSTQSEAPKDNCPRLMLKNAPRQRLEALRALRKAWRQDKGAVRFGVSMSYCEEVFRLCEALWGFDLENNGVPAMDELSIVTRHKKLLEWFVSAVASVTDGELAKPAAGEQEDASDGHSARVWSLLLGGRVLEACKVARQHGDLNMAALIAQAAGDPTFRSLISRQISLWRECGADGLIAGHRRAALHLCAGHTSPRDHLLRVDWLRALHATARYLCPQVPSLEKIIRTYESFFTKAEEVDLSTVEVDEMGMQFPHPPYRNEYEFENGKHKRVLDLRYELIRARAMNTRPKLQPAAYTPDPMDYSLCFILGVWFGNVSIEGVTGMAAQMEAAGLWHLAVLALAYHPDDTARGHLIRDVISRHAPAEAETLELKSRLTLLRRLGVPEQWILLAQAHRAKYERRPALEAKHLVGAGHWNEAHKVLIHQLLPDAVLADNLQSISAILEKLKEAAERHEISGWESGGQALHHYIHVCDEIRGAVSPGCSRAALSARLGALRPAAGAACRALARLPAHAPKAAAARADMAARLVQLALAAGEPPQHLAAILRDLQLPPDCAAHAHYKITTDLAEQASEMCIESASSSPISSHHRSTVKS